jgi:hypothetical protein
MEDHRGLMLLYEYPATWHLVVQNFNKVPTHLAIAVFGTNTFHGLSGF